MIKWHPGGSISENVSVRQKVWLIAILHYLENKKNNYNNDNDNGIKKSVPGSDDVEDINEGAIEECAESLPDHPLLNIGQRFVRERET